MEEIWKDIEGYEGMYMVSSLGRVKTLIGRYKNVTILKEGIKNNGYCSITLYKNKKPHHYWVHRLVAQAFIPNPNNYPVVNHKDENPSNNLIWINEDGSIDYEKSNLEWCTQEYNINYGNGNIKRSLSHKGKRFTKTHIENMSKARIGKMVGSKNYKSIPVAQYNKNGEFITVYESARIAEQALHLPNKSGQHILDCARGKLKTAYGFIWKLAS